MLRYRERNEWATTERKEKCEFKDVTVIIECLPSHLPLAVSLLPFLNGCRFTNSISFLHFSIYQSMLLAPSPKSLSIFLKKKKREINGQWARSRKRKCVLVCERHTNHQRDRDRQNSLNVSWREKPLTSLCLANPGCFPKPANECDLYFPSMQQCSPVDTIPCFPCCLQIWERLRRNREQAKQVLQPFL